MTKIIWNKCSNFVARICQSRDGSHGHGHMQKVAKNSLLIFQNSEHYKDNEIFKLIVIVAWLHDVPDHKYDKDGSIKKKHN